MNLKCERDTNTREMSIVTTYNFCSIYHSFESRVTSLFIDNLCRSCISGFPCAESLLYSVIFVHYWTKVRRIDWALGNVQDFSKSLVLRDDFIVIPTDWTSQACYYHLQWKCFHLVSLGSLVSICIQCSGGLLNQRHEHNILLVCRALWHSSKLQRCIILAKDQGQSDGWTGMLSCFSCSVFVVVHLKQGEADSEESAAFRRKFVRFCGLLVS